MAESGLKGSTFLGWANGVVTKVALGVAKLVADAVGAGGCCWWMGCSIVGLGVVSLGLGRGALSFPGRINGVACGGLFRGGGAVRVLVSDPGGPGGWGVTRWVSLMGGWVAR